MSVGAIVGACFLDPRQTCGSMVLDGSVIQSIGAAADTEVGDVADAEVIHADGLFAAAGFVDLQINGGFGIDLLSDPDGMWELGRRLPQTGVTAFQPTIVSSSERVREAAMVGLAHRPSDYVGADPFGLHFEGPILASERRGAHRMKALRPADPELVSGWTRRAGVSMVTLAPELPGALDLIDRLVAAGVTVALGHSDASAHDAVAAADAGASAVTHLFNAMAPFHHREPGLAGVALADDRLFVGVIVDGVHLDPRAVSVAWQSLGADRFVLVTDAVSAMGAVDTEQVLGGARVSTEHGAVRNDAGVLAGSVLTMDAAVRNLVEWAGCDLTDAVRCATANPARAVRSTDRGALVSGARADIVLLDDDLDVVITMCAGEIAFVRDDAVDRVPTWRREGST